MISGSIDIQTLYILHRTCNHASVTPLEICEIPCPVRDHGMLHFKSSDARRDISCLVQWKYRT
jgi:hypothetical protein